MHSNKLLVKEIKNSPYYKITERIDEGEILFQEIVPIYSKMDARLLDEAIADKASITMKKYLDALMQQCHWEPTMVDATSIYRVPVNYLSFPGK